MARCGCAGSSCSCSVQGGAGVTVAGVGSADRPYVISSTPVSESVATSSTFYTVGENGTPPGSLNAFSVEFGGSVATAYIQLPDGTGSVPLPPPGAQFDFFVTGSPTALYQFYGGAIVWGTDQPTGNQQGWYHFVYLPTAGGSARYLATYLGL
jgi:hypothetical protein